jgi:hypothetical protein
MTGIVAETIQATSEAESRTPRPWMTLRTASKSGVDWLKGPVG